MVRLLTIELQWPLVQIPVQTYTKIFIDIWSFLLSYINWSIRFLVQAIWIWLIIPYNKVNLWCVLSSLGWKLFKEGGIFFWVINNLFNIQLMISNLQLFLNQTYCNCIFLKYINHSFPQKVKIIHIACDIAYMPWIGLSQCKPAGTCTSG